jgi:hypothetical protein
VGTVLRLTGSLLELLVGLYLVQLVGPLQTHFNYLHKLSLFFQREHLVGEDLRLAERDFDHIFDQSGVQLLGIQTGLIGVVEEVLVDIIELEVVVTATLYEVLHTHRLGEENFRSKVDVEPATKYLEILFILQQRRVLILIKLLANLETMESHFTGCSLLTWL